jgi:(1->4)-alpha-D-glucan 1-alpha-D-glucosylmutase
MHIPTATYRLQLSPDFTFNDAAGIVQYLSDLGISHIYASPIFKARTGSRHGYDIVDPNQLNPELGTPEDFESLIDELRRHDMHWLQDIVPNHMAYDSNNLMLMDVLEKGPASQYFGFFDIAWTDPATGDTCQLLAPFLGRFYGEVLEAGEIRLVLDGNGFGITYGNLRLPLRLETYANVLERNLRALKERLGPDNPALATYADLIHKSRDSTQSSGSVPPPRGTNDMPGPSSAFEAAKKAFLDLVAGNQEVRSHLENTIAEFNGHAGDPASFDLLDDLLSHQLFRLAFWKVAAQEINYRRFANVNLLIGVRIEDGRVFDHSHNLIFDLIERGIISGLRIDHIDGLFDPAAYLERLHGKAPDTYMAVEKILASGEDLPPAWPVQGTTGYEFMNGVNGVFIDSRNAGNLTRLYRSFTGVASDYGELVRQKKKLVMERHMPETVDNLTHSAMHLAQLDRGSRDITVRGLRHALTEVMTGLSVYRTYVDERGIGESDRRYLSQSLDGALKKNPDHTYELNFLRKILLMEFTDDAGTGIRDQALDFIMRLQQFTGPLMAKGFEDTVFYVYNRLLSLNEVGGYPDRFGVSLGEFHDFNRRRLASHPDSMNATSTHDTKRGEDVRARLNVLSEMPEEWEKQVKTWRRLNYKKKLFIEGARVPDKNDEYFLYQTLVGAFPFEEGDLPAFTRRLRDYVIRAVREAKAHTAWIKPDSEYENAFILFVERILEPSESNDFLREFIPFRKKIAHYGILNSLSLTLLRLTAPGVPDTYQGCELWNLSLVDPDNRRPVDFAGRMSYLQDMADRARSDPRNLTSEILSTKEDGRMKLFLIYKGLGLRKQRKDLFARGDYMALETTGKHQHHVVASARKHESQYAVTVAPRFFTTLVNEVSLPLGRDVWEDTTILVPEGFPGRWRDAISDRLIEADHSLRLGDVLERLPVALLVNEGGES